jgi:RND family efflux transporter MFP subunit
MNKAMIALVMAVLFVAGCGQRADHADVADGHSHNGSQHEQDEKETQTLFSEDLELFVEYDPIIVNEVSVFNVHVTDLNKGHKPIADAEVSLKLEIDREVKQQFEGALINKGIYQFEVSPQFSGEGLIQILVKKGNTEDRFEIDHLHIFKEKTDVHTHGPGPATGEVSYTKEQAWATDFEVRQVPAQDFSQIIKASGELLAMPGEKQNLVAKNEGIVLFSKTNLVQGSPVTQGELLFTISGRGFTDDNISVQYHDARLQFEKSKNQYIRHKNLVEDKIVTRSQFLESRNQYLTDSIEFYYLEKNVSDGGLKVFAPLNGYIHELNVSEGQYSSTGTILATISSNRVMLLRADVPQQYFDLLGQINDATFRPAYSGKVYSIDELNGRLLAKASSVAENNHYMPVYFEVLNDGTLLEGAFAEFNLRTRPEPGVLVVPISSLIEEQNNFYVYVQLSGERYLKKQVHPGDSDGLQTAILDGLSEGERVVVRGALLLKGASVSTAPVHSHTH